jgi:hypothetical protein
VRDFGGTRPGVRGLILVPVAPFRDSRASLPAVAASVAGA